MKLKIISLSLLFVSIFYSCKKDEQLIIGNNDVPLLSKVIIADQPYHEYLYNDANLISEEKSKFDFTMHQYNDKNQLVTTDYYGDDAILSSSPEVQETVLNRKDWVNPDNSEKGGSVKYEYNNNEQLIKTTFSRPLVSNTEYSEFTYDVDDRISRQTLYWENKISGYIDYLYDGSGNLIKEILYYVPSTGVAEMSTITRYEFDNKQNPYKSFNSLMTPGINTNRNNIIRETYTIHFKVDQGPETVQITETSYAYNDKGYPIRKNGTVGYVYE